MMWTDFKEAAPPRDGRWIAIVCADHSGIEIARYCNGDWQDPDGTSHISRHLGCAPDDDYFDRACSMWAPMPPGFKSYGEIIARRIAADGTAPSVATPELRKGRKKAAQPVDKLMYSIAETAAALGLSERTIYNLLDSGDLPKVKIGRRNLIPADAVRAAAGGRPVQNATHWADVEGPGA